MWELRERGRTHMMHAPGRSTAPREISFPRQRHKPCNDGAMEPAVCIAHSRNESSAAMAARRLLECFNAFGPHRTSRRVKHGMPSCSPVMRPAHGASAPTADSEKSPELTLRDICTRRVPLTAPWRQDAQKLPVHKLITARGLQDDLGDGVGFGGLRDRPRVRR